MERKLESIKFYKINELAVKPERMSENAAGFNLQCYEPTLIKKHSSLTINLGLAVTIPNGYFAQIVGKVALARKRIYAHNGIIDGDYRDEIRLVVENRGTEDVLLEKGTIIAQLVFQKFETPVFDEITPDEFKELQDSCIPVGFGRVKLVD